MKRKWKNPITCVESAELGRANRIVDAAGRYIEFCKGTFPNENNLNGLKVVVDCAHGATYHIAPNVFVNSGLRLSLLVVSLRASISMTNSGATDVRMLSKNAC